jgi:CheY-like chemotaxis protein
MTRVAKAPSETLTATLATGLGRAARARILLVEDEKTLLRAIAKMLERHGFSVLTATDGTDAVALLRRHGGDIALLLLDVTLPGVSSREVLEEARRIRPDMPVILTSAHSENVLDSFFAGVQIEHFLRKPYRLAALVNLVQSVLAEP